MFLESLIVFVYLRDIKTGRAINVKVYNIEMIFKTKDNHHDSRHPLLKVIGASWNTCISLLY